MSVEGGCELAQGLRLCLVLGQGPCWDHSGEKWSTGQVEGGLGFKGRPWAPHGDHPDSVLLREAAGTLPGMVQCSEVVRVPPSPSWSWRDAQLQGQDGKECGGWAGLSNIHRVSPCSLCAAWSPDLSPAVKVGWERVTSFHPSCNRVLAIRPGAAPGSGPVGSRATPVPGSQGMRGSISTPPELTV